MNTINSCEYIPTSKNFDKKEISLWYLNPGERENKEKRAGKVSSFFLSFYHNCCSVDAGMLCVHIIFHDLDAAVESLDAVVML